MLLDWHHLQTDRPDVNRLRANETVVGELLQHVRRPAARARKLRSLQKANSYQ